MPPRLILNARGARGRGRGRGQRGAATTAGGSAIANHNTGSVPPNDQDQGQSSPSTGREERPPGSRSQNVAQRQHSNLNLDRTTSTSLRLAPDRLRQFPPGSSSLHITLRIRTRSSEATGTNSDAPSAASRPSLVPDASLSPELEGESSELTPAADGPSPEVYHPADHSGRNPADPGRYLAAGIVPDNYEALLPIPRHHQELPSVPDASSSRATSFPANLPGPQESSTHDDMAPVKDTSSVHVTLKDIIQYLSEIQMQTHGYVPETQNLMVDKMTDLAESLSRLQTLTSPRESPNNPIHNVQVAPEIIDYVDDGRNPDIFTRDFVENVQRGNAVINGKQQAFRDFTEIYAQALKEGIPGTSRQVDKVMENLGFGKATGESANGSQPADASVSSA